MVEIRVPYRNYGRVQFECTQPSMTHQCFKDHCDINQILARNPDVTQVQHVNNAQSTYGDFSDVSDYRDALDRVCEAQDHFDQLPAIVRERFGNDPGEFLEFALNPANVDEMVKLGLADSKVVESAENASTAAQPENSA